MKIAQILGFGAKKSPEQMRDDYQKIMQVLMRFICDNVDESRTKILFTELQKRFPDYIEYS